MAHDGYVVASCTEVDEAEAAELKRQSQQGDWHVCSANDCLAECVAAGCSCSRAINPAARDAFLMSAAERITQETQGMSEAHSKVKLLEESKAVAL